MKQRAFFYIFINCVSLDKGYLILLGNESTLLGDKNYYYHFGMFLTSTISNILIFNKLKFVESKKNQHYNQR